MDPKEKDQFLEAGKIINTHGIRGEVKIQPWCDGPEFLCEFDSLYVDGKPLEILSSRIHKGNTLVLFAGYDSIDKAETLKNKIVYIDRDDVELPEGRHFIADLIGLTVKNHDTGEVLGKLVDVLDYPTQDIYVIKGEHEYMIPAVDAFTREIHVDEGWMSVVVLEGMATDAN
jgi:16S rRNA processing protein RimM